MKPGDADEVPAFHAPASYAPDEAVAHHVRLAYGDDEGVAHHVRVPYGDERAAFDARRDLDEITTTPRERAFVTTSGDRARRAMILEETVTESDAITAPVRGNAARARDAIDAPNRDEITPPVRDAFVPPVRDAMGDLDEATTVPWTRGTGHAAFTWKPF
jgi:hypothetical protein